MKKVKQVAEELGVSSQTVYNYLNKMEKELDDYIKEVEGVKHIEQQGIEIIKDQLDIKEVDQEDLIPREVLKRENELLHDQIEYLKEQIERKDQRLERYQYLLQDKKQQVEQLEGEVQPRPGLIKKIKNFFKK